MDKVTGVVIQVICPTCGGVGKVAYGTLTCGKCNGKKVINKVSPLSEVNRLIHQAVKRG